ncbi:uncharacterized protein LOC122298585 isoform X2 [Carya illinoinensis]|uniref:uncharacterized protein LOC122298585 isoform X2 n=1 Tax=Carya illinoinensis TaxID=32201 RepID=UPI001C726B6B|nr:uncharacterized protein LOC122298585 isoform X2 [Carya illinoinensis]
MFSTTCSMRRQPCPEKMDKSWMHISDRLRSNEYDEGVRTFMAMALANARGSDRIRCPCRRCRNYYFQPIATVEDHLFIIGIDPRYTKWIFHGEEELLNTTFSDDSKDVNDSEDDSEDVIDDMDDMSKGLQAGAFMDNSARHRGGTQDPTFQTGKMVHISKVRRKGTQVSAARSMSQQSQQPIGHLGDEVGIGSDDSAQAPEKKIEGSNDATEAQPNVEVNVPPTRKRGRGAAKSTWFDRLRKLGKIPLKIKEGQTAPSCENATIFAGRVTWIVKLHAEMRRASWTHVPENEKEELIDRVRDDFILDWTKANHRQTVIRALSRQYNAFHYQLRQKYLEYGSHEIALSSGTTLVKQPVWEWLCDRWNSEGFKKVSLQNTANRQKQKVKHTCGRKSFVRMMEEKGCPNLGASYKEIHCSRKKSTFVDATTEHSHNQVVETLNEMEQNENINDAAAAAFREGPGSGYVRGLGHSVKPGAPPSVCNSLEFHRIVAKNEKNFNNAEYHKDQFETLKCDLLALRNRMKQFDQRINSYMSKMKSHRESQRDAPGDV